MTTEPTPSTLGTDALLDLSRTLTLLVASDGEILEARGGYGGFLGLDAGNIVGDNVFVHVAPADAGHLATYFIENLDEAPETIALPVPFRMSITDPDGRHHPVDVIPTGRRSVDDDWQWVAVLVPVALNGSITRSLDLEMEGADRESVKRMLCEELAVDNTNYTSRWMLIEFPDETRVEVVTSRPEDVVLAEAVRDDVAEGWAPWLGVEPATVRGLEVRSVGDRTRAVLDGRGWRRVIVAPVQLHGRIVAVYLLLGRVPDEYLADTVKANVAARIETLVRATALLLQRWDHDDQLRLAATHDPLTGLHNTRSFEAELADRPNTGAILFVDVDHFKSVNDVFGHAVGDRVLTMIADRVVTACRDGDLVARVGGDEFVIVLDGADEHLAASIAERVIATVGAPLELDVGPDSVTVSIGQAPFDGVGAVEAADRAMRLAKQTGRSRLSIAAND